MHIVHLVDSSSRLAGGMFESVKGLAHGQRRQGLKVSIVAGSDEFSEQDRASWEDLDLFNAGSSGFSDRILGRDIIATLDRLAPDLIHLHGIWGVGSRALARRSRRVATPYVVSPRGMFDVWALRRSALKKKLSALLWENALLRDAAFLHALTPSEEAATRALGLTGEVAVIPNGVSLPDCVKGDAAKPLPRQMLFLGRLHPKKGVAELLAAWSALPPRVQQEWHLTIAGWDEISMLEGLRKQVAALGLTGRVSFPGGVYGAQKDALFEGASAFILPSFSEGLPMAVLEAWSHSLPVFMTAECNLPEGFACGASFEITTQPAQITQTLSKMLVDEATLKQAGQVGRVLVQDSFGWDAIAAKMAERYRGALTGLTSEGQGQCLPA